MIAELKAASPNASVVLLRHRVSFSRNPAVPAIRGIDALVTVKRRPFTLGGVPCLGGFSGQRRRRDDSDFPKPTRQAGPRVGRVARSRSIRGHRFTRTIKAYVFALLFFKRICDANDEEYEAALAELEGDEEYARFPRWSLSRAT